ncbi:MAG: efflux RND transporter permease subunit [Cytophagales bacterium]|nr:efflux RND transporter permease subunit [Cytophagales bacterium]
MNIDEIIKKKIEVETSKLQIHLVVVIALAGGVYSLFDKLHFNIINQIIFSVGFIFLITFAIIVLRNYITIINLFKKLDKGGKNNV